MTNIEFQQERSTKAEIEDALIAGNSIRLNVKGLSLTLSPRDVDDELNRNDEFRNVAANASDHEQEKLRKQAIATIANRTAKAISKRINEQFFEFVNSATVELGEKP